METPVAETKLGQYKGNYIKTFSDRQIAAFRGIRYAKPPVRNLRFQEPVKVEAHEGIYDATNEGDDCIQENQIYTKYPDDETQGKKIVGSEDCLFLNIFTPEVKAKKLLPVLVFIHGGGYYKGTCSYNWHGPHLLLDKDIVLVTITYRLGVFGFLVLDDNVIPSNLGLKDQSLALHWIKDHISSFGGDPNSITISGNSAGGACAELHMLSPRSKGLITRAIAQSGAILCPWAMRPRSKAIATTMSLASLMNCPSDPSKMLASLQDKTVDEIMAAISQLKGSNPLLLWDTMFAPVFETVKGGFITKEDVLTGSDIPWMAGVTHDEGFLFYRDNYRMGDGNLSSVQSNYHKILPVALGYDGNPDADKISEEIKQFYFGKEDISDKSLTQYINMLSDGVFIHDLLQRVRKHKGKSYMYLLSHQGKRSLTSELPVAGVCHADELFYLYPFSKRPIKLQFTEADLKVKDIFVEMWSNFVLYGNPTPEKGGEQWPESENGKLFVSITSEGIKPSQHIFPERMNFWDELSDKKYKITKGGFKL